MFVVYKYSSLLVYICHGLESHGAQMKLNNICNGMNRHRSEKKKLRLSFLALMVFLKDTTKEYSGHGCLDVHSTSKYKFSSSSSIIKINGCLYLVQL